MQNIYTIHYHTNRQTTTDTLKSALKIAFAMDLETQPAHGPTTIELDGETIAETRNGKIVTPEGVTPHLCRYNIYYSREDAAGDKIYSFSLGFEDYWTQADEDAGASSPSKY